MTSFSKNEGGSGAIGFGSYDEHAASTRAIARNHPVSLKGELEKKLPVFLEHSTQFAAHVPQESVEQFIARKLLLSVGCHYYAPQWESGAKIILRTGHLPNSIAEGG